MEQVKVFGADAPWWPYLSYYWFFLSKTFMASASYGTHITLTGLNADSDSGFVWWRGSGL